MRSSQFLVIGKRRIVDNEQSFNDVSAKPNIYSAKLSQMAATRRGDVVEDVDDDDIGMEMNKQVPLKDLNPTKTRLNYN
jgi:hypothetical protein